MAGSPTIKIDVDLSKVLTIPDRMKVAKKDASEALKILLKAKKEGKDLADALKKYEQAQGRVQDLQEQISDKKFAEKLRKSEERAKELEAKSGGPIGRAYNGAWNVVSAIGQSHQLAKQYGELFKSYNDAETSDKFSIAGDTLIAAGSQLITKNPLAGAIVGGVGVLAKAGASIYQGVQGKETDSERRMRLAKEYYRYVSTQDKSDFETSRQNLRGLKGFDRDLAEKLGYSSTTKEAEDIRENVRYRKDFVEGGIYGKLKYKAGQMFGVFRDRNQENDNVAQMVAEADKAMNGALDKNDFYEYSRAAESYGKTLGKTFRSADEQFSMIQSTTFAKLNYARSQLSRARSRTGD